MRSSLPSKRCEGEEVGEEELSLGEMVCDQEAEEGGGRRERACAGNARWWLFANERGEERPEAEWGAHCQQRCMEMPISLRVAKPPFAFAAPG